MNSKFKRNKGITLIALIITIVILLILSIVVISAIQGDGILNYAKKAKSKYSEAQTNESETLEQYNEYLDFATESNYIPVEYLESTGTQWIDTGVNAETGVSCELKASYTKLKGNATLLGASKDPNRFYLVNIDNPSLRWSMGYGNYYLSEGKPEVNVVYQINVDLLKNKQSVTVDGEVVISQNLELEINLKENLYLFALNLNGAAANYDTGKRVYNLKLYDNDILVRDFIPVLDKEGTPCMYDKVEGKFYYNQGSGQFLYKSKEVAE